jgi:mRNA interferase MazF
MIEGDVAITPLPQADGLSKPRPVILLRQMPPFGDWLVCGISTQLQLEVAGFDELIGPNHGDFPLSGLKIQSLIRLGFLAMVPVSQIPGVIGSISPARHHQLMERLSAYLQP